MKIKKLLTGFAGFGTQESYKSYRKSQKEKEQSSYTKRSKIQKIHHLPTRSSLAFFQDQNEKNCNNQKASSDISPIDEFINLNQSHGDLLARLGTENSHKSKKYEWYRKNNKATSKWSNNPIQVHFNSPFSTSILAPINPVNDANIPIINSNSDGRMADCNTLGRKYPTTLYRRTPFDKSSAYLENNRYWDLENLTFTKNTLANYA